MSLGSKELFHSNFLEWLSFINWDIFLNVLHSLADVRKFWWEGVVCPIEVKDGDGKKVFHPNNENIAVRREYKHYDLSIYLVIGRTKKNNLKWVPVFVLENKVKSMPYQYQLDSYAQKAYGEWGVNDINTIMNNNKINKNQVVTAVLLTLFDGNTFNPSPIDSINKLKWVIKNYDDLLNSIKGNYAQIQGKEKDVVEDYCTFIEALHNLSNTDDWQVRESDIFHDKILQIKDEEKGLRIADLQQKVLHERMLKILEGKLQVTFLGKCEHWSKDKEYKDKNKKNYNTGIVFYETAFSRGTGAIQVFVIINQKYRLMIQLQNGEYRKCVILHPIKKNITKKMNTLINNLESCIWQGYNPQRNYGDFFKYKPDPNKIKDTDTIGAVLDEIVDDLNNIIQKIKQLEGF